jgi:hypothetical protein
MHTTSTGLKKHRGILYGDNPTQLESSDKAKPRSGVSSRIDRGLGYGRMLGLFRDNSSFVPTLKKARERFQSSGRNYMIGFRLVRNK